MTDPDADLLAKWDDLCARLIWRYGPAIAKARYEALADSEEPDLLAWRRLGKAIDDD